ncbi:hypothetical protein BBI17_006397 [Phytophthora kernoviae]|uniref:Uncharacterized protein n=1 Tax=Phytophthora kernoviae TaxID=325452 RepID=A0A3R7JTL2_9STRA|nr:hypothetical protein BBI17_006397 [Phytophthora kernoviae]
MSMLLMPATTFASFSTTPLEPTHSHPSIYDYAPMSGENIHRRRVLPVDNSDSYSENLEDAYACNMESYFGEMPTVTKIQSASLSRQQKALNEALLQLAQSQRSIYDKVLLSGENCSAQCVLPLNRQAEMADSCSDADDHVYATEMTNYFVTQDTCRLSAYEAKRLRRIEENQHKLLSLNIPLIPRRVTRTGIRKNRDATAVIQPVRRSQRQRNLNSTAHEFDALESLAPLQPKNKRMKVEPSEPLALPVTRPTELLPADHGKKQHLSSSQLEIDFEKFHSQCLGTQLLPMGKQTAMQGLCPPGYVVKFSKMSGVQPWKNAVVLFVNVESDSPYDNVFRQEEVGGKSVVHFQWFGQNRWNDDSPMGPYIYCGQLGYLGYHPSSKPIEFRWQLLDVGALDWGEVRGLLAATDPSSKTDDV